MHRVVRSAGHGRFVAMVVVVLAVSGIGRAAQAQTRVTGRIVDPDNAPIAAAQVQVTGTNVGANTSDSGTFTLQVPPDGRSLTIRRIGFLGQTVPLTAGQTRYTVTLTRDVLRLEAQVVTGVATSVSAKSSANDVAVVDAQAVNAVPAPTIENAIQGLVPGAIISQNNGGEPGGGMQIQIRGITSIFADAEPLYVIDGVIVNNQSQEPGNNAITFSTDGGVQQDPTDLGTNRIADFNPDDIASIEVLKGASASAIYGSQASAGVVIITTKRGTAGKPTWNFSQKVGHFEQAATMNIRRFPTLASAQAWYNNDINPPATAAATASNNAFISGIYDGPQAYQTQLFGNPAASYETDLSVSGTQGPTQYFLSALSKYDNGSLLYTGYNKQSIRSNVTQQVANGLSASANLFYAHSNSNRGISGNDNNGISPYDVFSYTPGFMNLNHVDADGSWAHNYFGNANPFANAQGIATPENIQRFTGGGTISWTPYSSEHQSLQFTAQGGADIAHVEDDLFAPSNLQFEQAEALPGVATDQTSDDQYINYSINVIHHYTGISWLDATTSAGFVREKRDFLNPETVSQNLLAGEDNPSSGTVQTNFYNRTAERNQSLYGQEQLLLLDTRLTLTGGVTAERTTNDGDIGKFFYYPRYSGSYRIPQFASFLDELKLRVAYGQSGTEPNYGVRYTPLEQNVDAAAPAEFLNSTYGDANIEPEAETEIETGFDATMFHSRAQFTFTVYQKRISNLLLQAGVSPSRGYNTQWLNGGEFTNQGAEISLTGTPIQLRNGFTAVSTISYFRNYSVVNSLPASVPNFDEFYVWIEPGRSISDVVNPNVSGVQPQLGDVMPDFTMDFSQELHYGPFQANAVVQWNKGSVVMIQTADYYAAGTLWGDSAYAENWLSRFNNNQYNWIQGAGFVKLRSLSLAYNLPSKWVTGFAGGRFTSARLSLEGRNLLHLYERGYIGLDPEVASGGNNNILRNIEITPYPPSASYFLSLDVGF
jgi:TonB-dependent starch-binding outer membrane protein SusC